MFSGISQKVVGIWPGLRFCKKMTFGSKASEDMLGDCPFFSCVSRFGFLLDGSVEGRGLGKVVVDVCPRMFVWWKACCLLLSL